MDEAVGVVLPVEMPDPVLFAAEGLIGAGIEGRPVIVGKLLRNRPDDPVIVADADSVKSSVVSEEPSGSMVRVGPISSIQDHISFET